MAVTAEMLAHLAQNVTFLTHVWKITARDGEVAAYTSTSRNVVFGGTTYKATPARPAVTLRKIGLEPDSADLFGVFDAVLTEADVVGGRWAGARIYKGVVNYLDPSMGAVAEQNGFAGTFSVRNGTYTVEFLSLSHALSQTLGDLTSPTDRNPTLADLGVNVVDFTRAGTVSAVTDRRTFAVDLSPAAVDAYYKYGLIRWTGGANDGLEMEVKDNTGNAVSLQLPMRSTVAVGDAFELVAGYDGTRAQARDKFSVMVNFDGEPDLPGIGNVLKYPV